MQVNEVDQIAASNASNVISAGAFAILRQKYWLLPCGGSGEMPRLLMLWQTTD